VHRGGNFFRWIEVFKETESNLYLCKGEIEQITLYLYVDISYYKVRDETRCITKAAQMVTRVQEDDCRDTLGTRVIDRENEVLWSRLFEDLKKTRVTGI